MKLQSGFESKLLAVFAAALVVVAVLTSITWKLAQDAAAAARLVRHTQDLQNALARVRVDTALVELNTQSFRITGDPARLVDRDAAIHTREALLLALHTQTADNPRQRARWAQLRAVVDERLAISRRVEQLRITEGVAAANAYVAGAPLVATRTRVQQLLNEMDAEETRLLDERSALQLGAGRRLVAAGAAASATLLALLVATYFVLSRQLRLNEAGGRALAASEALLERRVIERTAQLRSSEQQLARVLEGADQGYWDWNLQTNEFRVSARWETMLGYEPGELKVAPEHWHEVVHADDLPKATASIERHLAGLLPLHEAEFRCRTKQGEWRWILTRGRVVTRAEDGTPLMMSGTHTDVTERKLAELAQRESAVVFESSYEGIMVANVQGLITKINPAFTRITGYTDAEVMGRSPAMLSSGRHDKAFYQAFWASLIQKGYWHGEIWNRRKAGDLYATLQSVSAVRDANGQVLHYISVFADITHLKTHAAELDRVAHFDPLTGLPNRRLLSDRLQQTMQRSARSGKSSAVCFLDLDGFKSINDQLGHAAGDRLLVGVAEHLKAVLRGEDTLARLGGDEFVILLSEVSSLKEGATILDRVLQAVRQPVHVDGRVLSTSASIGVSLFPDDNVDPETLLRHADQTMYLAKQAGKNRYQLFDPEVDRRAHLRREQLDRLRLALQQGELLLHYQPKVNLTNGDVVGAEALIRWMHPERGLLPPAEFLPQVQGSDLEQDLGEWVIETALTQMAAWAAQGLPLPVSVNISARHLLQADFCARLAPALQRHPGVRAADLELEVLETAAISDMQQAVQILHDCMALGVQFSLDDFGTGYSSLTYLRKLPVHTLKIDQSFVRNMLADPEDMGIVRGVIQLASAFNRRVIAEGVETMEHGRALVAMGCHFAQGYGIARPMPAAAMQAWRDEWLLAHRRGTPC